MNKKEFWKPLEERFPDAMGSFKSWIDIWKEDNNWDELFNKTSVPGEEEHDDPVVIKPSPKFHNLPPAMQVGIFIEFMNDVQLVQTWNVDLIKGDLQQMIVLFLSILDERIKTDLTKRI